MGSPSTQGSVHRDVLVRYLDQLLDAARGTDYCPNGLQVEGRDQVSRLVTGVSACRELFELAVDAEADAVLVHHGLFWKGDSPRLTGIQYQRVATLIRSGLSLIAYHLPLDRHLELGNNAVAAQRLGLQSLIPFCEHEGSSIGVAGQFPEPVPRQRVIEQLAEIFQQQPLTFLHGKTEILSVGLVSGAAGRCFHSAIAEDLDLFVTGEPEEWTLNLAKEARANYVAGGHYATERLGVQALGERLRKQFHIEIEFIDLPNPV